MIIVREYNVSPDGKWLTLDIMIDPNLTGAYISGLRISCTGSFASTDTSATLFDTLIAAAKNAYTGLVIDFTADYAIRIKLDVSSFNKPFYMIATATDPQGKATTCAYKNPVTAVTFNKYPLYKAISCAAKQLDGCEPPAHFVDFLMHLKALEASIAVGDAASINSYYNWLVLHGGTGTNCATGTTGSTPPARGCGCNK